MTAAPPQRPAVAFKPGDRVRVSDPHEAPFHPRSGLIIRERDPDGLWAVDYGEISTYLFRSDQLELVEPAPPPAAAAFRCRVCETPLNIPGRPWTDDCGGDCTACMADAGDPDAIAALAPTEAALASAVEAENEACALIIEEVGIKLDKSDLTVTRPREALSLVASAIRARRAASALAAIKVETTEGAANG
jgi:hypothetical protein